MAQRSVDCARERSGPIGGAGRWSRGPGAGWTRPDMRTPISQPRANAEPALWAAVVLGRLGGSARSEKKTRASRANGQKGGRARAAVYRARRVAPEEGGCADA
jgi:hypothetical protein